MGHAIVARGLTKRFASLTAVENLDLEVPSGQIFGLVGPDGAGKTTTIRILVGVMDPTSGSATVAGVELAELHTARDRIGYMSQRFGLYEDLTVMENLRFFAQLQDLPVSTWKDRAHRFLDMTGLTPFTERQAGHLSGGMKQKLGLACAMLHTPQVLFLDEPTAGVDPVSRRDFWHLLYDLLEEGVTIFLATSYLDEAERCGRLGLIHKGRLLVVDTPDAIRKAHTLPGGQEPDLEEVFTSMVRDSVAS